MPLNVTRLVGVVRNGTGTSPRLPANTRQELRMSCGATQTIDLQVLQSTGEPFDLTSYTVTLTVKKNTMQDYVPPGLKKTGVVVHLVPSTAVFSIAPNDTKFMATGRYVYDIWISETGNPGQRACVVQLSPFILEPAATLP